MKHCYPALDMVEKVLYRYHRKNHYINNWKLQKILFLIQRVFTRTLGYPIIEDDFYLEPSSGIVVKVPEVYDKYRLYTPLIPIPYDILDDNPYCLSFNRKENKLLSEILDICQNYGDTTLENIILNDAIYISSPIDRPIDFFRRENIL